MEKIENLINARELKLILVNKSDFSKWMRTKIRKHELIEDKDFFIKKEEIKLLRNKSTKTYCFFTIDATKRIILGNSKNEITKRITKELESGKTLENILMEIKEEKNKQIKTIHISDEDYPKQLKKINKPPQKLYVKGNIENLKDYGIAVIGSRDCSNYGREICKKFTNNLVGYNLNIISGLATGIDACAHRMCINAKGKTIAVLPSGFNNIFPKENQELLNQILEKGGTVVTEYPPDFEKTSESCKERNRIVSGLAIGTLVIEAEKRSGTSITVGYTNEQQKKAFCIPSSLLNSKGIGTNEMIKENKAKLVTKVEDIIEEFPELKLEKKVNFNFLEIIDKKKSEQKNIKPKINLEISEENVQLYNFLSKGPKTIDEIVQEIKEPIQEITYKLTLLELEGLIEQLPGKKFKIK